MHDEQVLALLSEPATAERRRDVRALAAAPDVPAASD